MKQPRFVFMLACLWLTASAMAQNADEKPAFSWSGYLETYYVYDFGQPDNHERPAFFYSFNRHNEVNLNFGYLMGEYNAGRVRGKLALATGTYMNANYAAEPGVLKNIFEANVGVKLSKNKNIWADAGIFASHIGFESAIGAICWNMTRSILAENSPYFLSGAKITYVSDNGQWLVSGLVLNGWQRIQRVSGNQTPALGHQLTWSPNSNITLNSSSFVGTDMPDSLRLMRYFHDFYAILQLTNKLGLITGFDIGAQQQAKGSNSYHFWYAPVVIARYAFTNKVALAARAEYYADKNGVIIATGTPNGFGTLGFSVNTDVQITPAVLWRTEIRTLRNNDPIFANKNNLSNHNTFAGVSLSLKL